MLSAWVPNRPRLLVLALLFCTGAAWAQPEQELPTFAQVKAMHRSTDALLLDRNGHPLADLRFDARVHRLDWVPLTALPAPMREALLAAEDKRFFEHSGVDWIAVAGAAWHNLWGRGAKRGASTLTMQLAGLLDPALRMPGAPGARRSLGQKWDQGLAAVELEKRWSKTEILEAYLNLAPFRGDLQGVSAASELLFGVSAAALSHREAVILAALLRGPNAPPTLVSRRACVLASHLGKAGLCDDIAHLSSERLDAPRGLRYHLAPHVARLLLRQPGQQIGSTLDAQVQRKLLAELERLADPAAAAVVLDNSTGEVLAWVGGQDPASADGVSAHRSLPDWWWPHLAALALERRQLTLASPLPDEQAILDANDARAGRAWYSLRSALSGHRSGALRTLAALVGRDAMAERLRLLGVEPAAQADGAEPVAPEVSLVQLAGAWRVLQTGGSFVTPKLLPGDNGSHAVLHGDVAYLALDTLGQSRTGAWDAVWAMPGAAANETVVVGSSERYTLALSVHGVRHGSSAWRTVARNVGALGGRAPSLPEGVVAGLVFFEPGGEPVRREWFLQGSQFSGQVAYFPGRRARIAYPQNGGVIEATGEASAHSAFLAQAAAPVHWLLDGKPLGEGVRVEADLAAGAHRLTLLSATDELLDSVEFAVAPPGVEQSAPASAE